jgi:hypothetical protein
MISRLNFCLAGYLLTLAACATDHFPRTALDAAPAGSVLRAVFEGTTPCSRLTRPLPQIPADTDCQQMLWALALYQDPATGAPTTYVLETAYGISQQGTPGLVRGGTPIVMRGRWSIVSGPDPSVIIYQLKDENDRPAVSFCKMSEDLIHVLSTDGSLLVGTAAWSFTLNRSDNRIPTRITEQVSSPPGAPTRPPIPPQPQGASVLGVFDGRVPCHPIMYDLLKLPRFAGCAKMKSRLTLYQDAATGAPSTYVFMGVDTIREGTWSIVRGRDGDPNAIVYRLALDGILEPVLLLKVDANNLYLLDRDGKLLVGDARFSYTLSRTDAAP